ncbi:MAG: helicase associated domain-containing protein, partial [Bacteroidota bacterium]
VCRQRWKESNKQLDPKHKSLLENLGLVWSDQIQKAKKSRWKSRIEELLAYQKKFGTLTVTSTDPTYHSLRIWTERMRQHERELHPSRRKQLRDLGFPFRDKIQKRKEERWEKMYQQLRVYYRKYKHSRVSIHYRENLKLGAWVNTQRRKGRDNVTPEQRRKLMQVRFVWDVQKEIKKDFESAWEDKFLKLQKFYDAHGHCYVPKDHSERGLYSWLNLQRKNRYKLTPDQVKKLNLLHFEWVNNIEIYRQRQWENRYNALLNFFTKYGHSNVPTRFTESPGLGPWVNQLKKGMIKLTPKRLEQLKRVKFEWPEKTLTLEERWQEKFKQLKEFYKIHRHVKIPLRYNGNTSLHDWLRHQRKLNKLGKLSSDHKRLLEKVGKKILLK